MHLSFRLYKKFRLLVVATLVISALAAGPALAGKGGRNRPTGSSAVCTVAPDPVSNDVEGYYTVFGSGFGAYQTLTIYVMGGSGTRMIFAQADDKGNLARSDWAPFLLADGQWWVKIIQSGDTSQTTLAACTFQVS